MPKNDQVPFTEKTFEAISTLAKDLIENYPISANEYENLEFS